jgi:hypothetical protein
VTAGQLTAARAPTRRGTRAELLVRALVVLGLAVDAVVHLRLAPVMDLAAPGGIGGGTLFRAQGAVAGVAALVLLLTGRRWAYVLAFLVALSALVPVLLYHFVDVPAIGPVPSMHDPLWSVEKVVSVVGEALAASLAVAGAMLTGVRRRSSTHR